jgi:hypothetical protein
VKEREAVQLLLIRAVEEHQPDLFPPEAISAASVAAVDTETEKTLLLRRAAYLFDRLPKPLKTLERLALLPEDWLVRLSLGAFLLGLVSNYLGPPGQIHVFYNPILFLVLWNLLVYGILVWRRARRDEKPAAPLSRGGTGNGGDPEAGSALPGPPLSVRPPRETSRPLPPVYRFLLPRLWMGWNRWLIRIQARRAGIADSGRAIAAFWDSYWSIGHTLIGVRVRTLIHATAIGLALGAVAGTYLRGLFFEYDAVWKSTFLHDPRIISTLLNGIMGPASLILSGALVEIQDVRSLLLPDGLPAGPWIHRMALTAFLVIVVPRAVLLALCARKAGKEADLPIDLSDPYFTETARTAKEGQIHRIRDGITAILNVEIGKLAEAVALFVRERFFDPLVVPSLISFRNSGGRLVDLENEIAGHGAKFHRALNPFLEASRASFEHATQSAIRRLVGRELGAPSFELEEEVQSAAGRFGQDLTGSLAGSMSDAIGVTITVAVTTAVATISGGVGKSMGVAILSALLGTTGPIGLLIGGLVGLLGGGGAYLVARDRLSGAAKTWRIPASLAKLALRDRKLEESRQAIHATVKRRVRAQLEPHVGAINEDILRGLAAAVGSPP